MNRNDLEIVLDELVKVRNKYLRRQDNLLAKMNTSVTFQGEKYFTRTDVMGALEGDLITSAQADRLLDKLEAKQTEVANNKFSGVLHILNEYIDDIQETIFADKVQKDYELRVKSIMESKHCSYDEAVEEIINDEDD